MLLKSISKESLIICTSSNLPQTPTPFLSVTLEHQDHIQQIKQLHNKDRFIELIIPYQLYSESLLNQASFAKRIIIQFQDQDQLQSLSEIHSQFILHNKFFHTKGVPLCHIKPEHAIEIFDPISQPKPPACQGCLLKDYCPQTLQSFFTPKPITDPKETTDLLTFLKSRKTPGARF